MIINLMIDLETVIRSGYNKKYQMHLFFNYDANRLTLNSNILDRREVEEDFEFIRLLRANQVKFW